MSNEFPLVFAGRKRKNTRELLVNALVLFGVLVCIASLVDTSLSYSMPCPDCGTAMSRIGEMRLLSSDGSTWTTTSYVYRCHKCQYDIDVPVKASQSTTCREPHASCN
jgi:hypothetical protein